MESSLARQAIAKADRVAQQPVPAPTPTPQSPPASEPVSAGDYPMPWDEPPATSSPEPDDVASRDGVDVSPDGGEEPPAAAPTPTPARAPQSAPADVPRAREAQEADSGPNPNLPPDLAGLASLLADAFGQPLDARMEPAPSSSEDDEPDYGFVDEPTDDADHDDDDDEG